MKLYKLLLVSSVVLQTTCEVFTKHHCAPCAVVDCTQLPTNCKYGSTLDHCGCCNICTEGKGERCQLTPVKDGDGYTCDWQPKQKQGNDHNGSKLNLREAMYFEMFVRSVGKKPAVHFAADIRKVGSSTENRHFENARHYSTETVKTYPTCGLYDYISITPIMSGGKTTQDSLTKEKLKTSHELINTMLDKDIKTIAANVLEENQEYFGLKHQDNKVDMKDGTSFINTNKNKKTMTKSSNVHESKENTEKLLEKLIESEGRADEESKKARKKVKRAAISDEEFDENNEKISSNLRARSIERLNDDDNEHVDKVGDDSEPQLPIDADNDFPNMKMEERKVRRRKDPEEMIRESTGFINRKLLTVSESKDLIESLIKVDDTKRKSIRENNWSNEFIKNTVLIEDSVKNGERIEGWKKDEGKQKESIQEGEQIMSAIKDDDLSKGLKEDGDSTNKEKKYENVNQGLGSFINGLMEGNRRDWNKKKRLKDEKSSQKSSDSEQITNDMQSESPMKNGNLKEDQTTKSDHMENVEMDDKNNFKDSNSFTKDMSTGTKQDGHQSEDLKKNLSSSHGTLENKIQDQLKNDDRDDLIKDVIPRKEFTKNVDRIEISTTEHDLGKESVTAGDRIENVEENGSKGSVPLAVKTLVESMKTRVGDRVRNPTKDGNLVETETDGRESHETVTTRVQPGVLATDVVLGDRSTGDVPNTVSVSDRANTTVNPSLIATDQNEGVQTKAKTLFTSKNDLEYGFLHPKPHALKHVGIEIRTKGIDKPKDELSRIGSDSQDKLIHLNDNENTTRKTIGSLSHFLHLFWEQNNKDIAKPRTQDLPSEGIKAINITEPKVKFITEKNLRKDAFLATTSRPALYNPNQLHRQSEGIDDVIASTVTKEMRRLMEHTNRNRTRKFVNGRNCVKCKKNVHKRKCKKILRQLKSQGDGKRKMRVEMHATPNDDALNANEVYETRRDSNPGNVRRKSWEVPAGDLKWMKMKEEANRKLLEKSWFNRGRNNTMEPLDAQPHGSNTRLQKNEREGDEHYIMRLNMWFQVYKNNIKSPNHGLSHVLTTDVGRDKTERNTENPWSKKRENNTEESIDVQSKDSIKQKLIHNRKGSKLSEKSWYKEHRNRSDKPNSQSGDISSTGKNDPAIETNMTRLLETLTNYVDKMAYRYKLNRMSSEVLSREKRGQPNEVLGLPVA